MVKKKEGCPFCGSKKIYIKQPYIDRITGKHEVKTCCRQQETNIKYAEKHFNPRTGGKPKLSSVAEW